MDSEIGETFGAGRWFGWVMGVRRGDPELVLETSGVFQLSSSDADRLRRALVARFGVDTGSEAFADAVAYSWEHRVRLASMSNPVGYLYRVGLSAARPHVRWRRRTVLLEDPRQDASLPAQDDELLRALAQLTHPQRVSVVMVHGHRATYEEVAALLGISVSAVKNHVHRALLRLRRDLERS